MALVGPVGRPAMLYTVCRFRRSIGFRYSKHWHSPSQFTVPDQQLTCDLGKHCIDSASIFIYNRPPRVLVGLAFSSCHGRRLQGVFGKYRPYG